MVDGRLLTGNASSLDRAHVAASAHNAIWGSGGLRRQWQYQNPAGQEKYSYDAFGWPEVTNPDGSGPRSWSNFGNRFMFTGREWLWELHVYDYRRRLYNPENGRFLQVDPTGLYTEGAKLTPEQRALFSPGCTAPDAFSSSELNLYRYCGDDPVNNADPFGLEFFPYNGPAIEVDQLYGGAGLGNTRVVTPVVVVPQSDGTYTLRLDVRITGIQVATRVKFHGRMETRCAEQKRVTVEEHERTEHGRIGEASTIKSRTRFRVRAIGIPRLRQQRLRLIRKRSRAKPKRRTRNSNNINQTIDGKI